MVTLLIVADDFTGALDTGVKFTQYGAQVRVITDYQYDFRTMEENADVLVVDAETRHLSPEQAYERVYGIVSRAMAADIPYIIKKTDSALRGNIGSELAAALQASGQPVLHFLPALPQMGRTTEKGCHYIDGIPVEDTVFGRDPYEPVTCSHIPDLIGRQSDIRVRVISDGEPAGAESEPLIAVYDAREQTELETLAGKINHGAGVKLLAGCAGIAEALSGYLKFPERKGTGEALPPRLLVACGSVNPITKQQLDTAEQNGFERIYLTPGQKLEADYFETEFGQAKLREIYERVAGRGCCILDTNDQPGGENTLEYARKHGIELSRMRFLIAERLGYLVKQLIRQGLDSTILITGGDSLLGFMNQVQASEMTPISELASGVVLSQIGIEGRACPIISKSGGFGGTDLLLQLAAVITEQKERKSDATKL